MNITIKFIIKREVIHGVTKKCNVCNKIKDIEKFRKNGKELKLCLSCREKRQSYKEKTKCKHGKRPGFCLKCGDWNLCECGNYKESCGKCSNRRCIHNKFIYQCKKCDPIGHIKNIIKQRIIYDGFEIKSKDVEKWIGCSSQEYIDHITSLLKEGMSWDNYGDWEIDHIIPINYNNPTDEERIQRFHYTNCQPLLRTDNSSKGNRYVG